MPTHDMHYGTVCFHQEIKCKRTVRELGLSLLSKYEQAEPHY